MASPNVGISISIIIVNFNTRVLLKHCLASIYARVTGLPFEVLVVDNGSSDGSAGMVADEFPQVRLLAQSENVGFARATNIGLRESRGSHLVLLNSDTEVIENPFRETCRYLDEHPDVGAVGCRILNPDGSLQSSTYGFPTVLKEIIKATGAKRFLPKTAPARKALDRFFGRRFPSQVAGYWEHDEERAVDYLKGACLMVPRLVVEKMGPLDEGFFLYGEEMEWCYRMRQSGLQSVFLPVGRILHHGEASAGGRWGTVSYHQYRSLYHFFAKHQPGALRWWRPLVFFGMAVRLALLVLAYLPAIRHREQVRSALVSCGETFMLALRGLNERVRNGSTATNRNPLTPTARTKELQ